MDVNSLWKINGVVWRLTEKGKKVFGKQGVFLYFGTNSRIDLTENCKTYKEAKELIFSIVWQFSNELNTKKIYDAIEKSLFQISFDVHHTEILSACGYLENFKE